MVFRGSYVSVNYGLPKPDFIDFDGDFRVNMYRCTDVLREKMVYAQTTQSPTQTTQSPTQTTQSLTPADNAVLTLLREQPSLTQKELALELGWTVDRVKYYLHKMKKQQIVRRVGSSHNGYWEILIG